jgi:hypothetical protein
LAALKHETRDSPSAKIVESRLRELVAAA